MHFWNVVCHMHCATYSQWNISFFSFLMQLSQFNAIVLIFNEQKQKQPKPFVSQYTRTVYFHVILSLLFELCMYYVCMGSFICAERTHTKFLWFQVIGIADPFRVAISISKIQFRDLKSVKKLDESKTISIHRSWF